MTKKASKSLSFVQALAALGADAKPGAAAFRALSDLDDKHIAELQTQWPELSADRRAYIAEGLRELAEEDIEVDFRNIFRFTLGDSDERVRLSAVEGLFEDDHPGLIPPLTALLGNDPSQTVRAAAAESLGRFIYEAEMERISPARRDQVYAALMGALLTTPEDSIIHRRALEALAYVSNEEVDLQIRDAYASKDDLLRLSAIVAMGRSSNRAYTDIVRSELHSISPAIRREAARACGELEAEDAVPDLGQLIDDPSEGVREAALEALAMIGGSEAKRVLEQAAASDDEELAEQAEAALEEFEFWHGELDFSLGMFDEEIQKPTRLISRRDHES